ncbi:MAG: phosphoglycerate kinase [Proteobacteria bacterium]|nr:phosphoglycerate kinase [Pseudomonadota bacterium]
MAIKRVDEFDFENKKVFVRVDFNVPLDENRNITDDTRVRAALPTIRHIMSHGGKVIIASHLGKPKGQVKPELSLKPVVDELSSLIGIDVPLAPDCIGEEVRKMVDALKAGELLVLENLRFHIGEEKNHPDFAKELANSCDIYINDAFGAAHRAHASIVGITDYIKEVGAGFLMFNETKYLSKLMSNPERPFLVLLGGVKVSDKIGVIEQLLEIGDIFLIGGAMATTFLKAEGFNVGISKYEEDKLDVAREILTLAKEKNKPFVLPTDVKVTKDIKSNEYKCVHVNEIPPDMMVVDIGEETKKIFCYEIINAKTLFWNGPLGAFENPAFQEGTFSIAKCITNQKNLISVVGGGDSAAAVRKSGFADGFTHVSTGGGATLEFLEGIPLPGIKALDRY